jgi:nitroreductase
MELTDAIRRRRMVRTYDPTRPVPRETIGAMLGLAVRAPSAGYSQGWHFLVLDDAASRASFWAATASGESTEAWLDRLRIAPALIVCFSDKQTYLERYAEPDKGWTDQDEARWAIPYWHVDTGMAAMIALLCAVEQGLGACFFGVPGERWDDLRAAFAVPARLTPIGVISLGYPAADLRSPSLRRGPRPQSDVVSYGSFAGTVPT